jgi:hypothetical protein
MYFTKLKFDDWLHHILMVVICLPLSEYSNCLIMTNHCLFFLSGFPGGINYLLLSLQRNELITKYTQKYYNNILNLWIRLPGCIISYTTGLIIFNMNMTNFTIQYLIQLFIGFCIMWNGIYFMEQVHRNFILYKK